MSFADMMTLLFCLFMVLFAISSVNTSKFEALQRSLQDAFSGAVLDGGKSMMNSGYHDEATKQAAVEPPLPSLRPLDRSTTRPRRPRPRRPRSAQRGGAGLPRAQAPDRQAHQGRRPAGQGQRHRPPSRPGHPAADRQGVLRLRRGDAEAGGAQAGRQDRRRRARRAHAPGRRRGPHRLAADRGLSTSRTGSCRARAPGRSSATSRPTASWRAACPSRATAARTRSPPTRRPKGARRTAGWRSSSPACTPTDTES